MRQRLTRDQARGRMLAAARLMAGLDVGQLALMSGVLEGDIVVLEGGSASDEATRLAVLAALGRAAVLCGLHPTEGIVSVQMVYMPTEAGGERG